MKPIEIKVGATYTNKGAERSRRNVLALGRNVWRGSSPEWHGEGLRYEQLTGHNRGRCFNMSIRAFAKWAGRRVFE